MICSNEQAFTRHAAIKNLNLSKLGIMSRPGQQCIGSWWAPVDLPRVPETKLRTRRQRSSRYVGCVHGSLLLIRDVLLGCRCCGAAFA